MDPQLPPSLEARYENLGVLGAGAMGVVFLARDRKLDREVALKLAQAFSSDEPALRFQREAEGLSRISHPNIVNIFDYGVTPEGPYLTMELLDGVDLKELLAERKPEALWERVRQDPLELMLRIGEALAALQEAGLVHRDLKPGNIVVTSDGRPVLIDFGLLKDARRTRLTATGQFVGTPVYMAPECLQGQRATPRSDWYSWGALLYELLEGRPPYRLEQVVKLVAGEELPPPPLRESRSGPLAPALARLLDPEPGNRPATLDEVRELLEGTTLPPSRPEPTLSGSSSKLGRSTLKAPAADTTVPAGPRPSLAGSAVRLVLPALLCLVGVGWFLSPSGEAPAPVPTQASADPDPEATARLRKAMAPVSRPYRDATGTMRMALGGRSFREHGDVAREHFRDTRLGLRWRRFLDALMDWLGSEGRLPFGPEDSRLLDEEILVLFGNLAQDYELLVGEQRLQRGFVSVITGQDRSTAADGNLDRWAATLAEVQSRFEGRYREIPEPVTGRLRCLRSMIARCSLKLDDDAELQRLMEPTPPEGEDPLEHYWGQVANQNLKYLHKRREDCQTVNTIVDRQNLYCLGPMAEVPVEKRLLMRGLMVSHWLFDRVKCPRPFDRAARETLEELLSRVEQDLEEAPWVVDLYLTWATLNTLFFEEGVLPEELTPIRERIRKARDRARDLLAGRTRKGDPG